MVLPLATHGKVCLYVDLDGALCATDTLWESLLELARQRPVDLFRVPFWVLRGKATFKREVSNRVLPDIASLPIRPEVLAVLNERKAAGQGLVLATAADERIARALADRLDLFEAVLASDGQTNLAAENKLAAVRQHAGGAFDYLGDSTADLPLLHECRQGYVAGPQDAVWQAAQAGRSGRPELTRLRPAVGGFKAVVKALRPHQWAKNVLVGVPLLVSHQIENWAAVMQTALAFAAFSLIASAVYIINDLLDLPSDRAHPTKRNRPFASGAVPIPVGLVLGGALFGAGLLIAFATVNFGYGGMIVLYLAITTLYSTFLKRKLVLDVFILAGLYTIRILAGAVAIKVEPSEWLLAFSMFIFTSLAMLKRYTELKVWSSLNEKWPAGRRYTITDMDLFRSMGPASAYAAVLVFALYISSPNVTLLYQRPQLLWLVCPVMLYWLTRLWFLTNRDKAMEDPVLFALTDRASIASGALVLLLVFLAT
jgi:4-hydroxybenzoate polyprenyltransferase/phosphoserine phosphatase